MHIHVVIQLFLFYTRCILLQQFVLAPRGFSPGGCRSSETCISNSKPCVCYLKIISCLLIFRKSGTQLKITKDSLNSGTVTHSLN